MDVQKVGLRREGGVAIITFSRPEARNALSPEMLDSLAVALEDCKSREIRAVVITGSGGSFCTGGDVKDFARMLEGGSQELSAHLKRLTERMNRDVVMVIRQLTKPVIASVNGIAAGAGFSLALACDLRIASQEARLFPAYASIGSVAAGGCTYYLPRLLGPSLAAEVYLMDQPISAQRAFDIGLVNLVVPADKLDKHTMEMARRLASGPTQAYGRMKALMDQAWKSDLESQLGEEVLAMADTALSKDFQEGITAFVEKRAPRFKGE